VNGVIRTLGGDVPTREAGPIYAHEHLIIDSLVVEREMTQIHLPSVDEGVAEVESCVAAGVRTMVDAMPAASGRAPEKLARISIRTGMRVVAATGLHTAKYYNDVPWTNSETPDVLAERFICDIEAGIDKHDYLGDSVDRTEVKAGLIKVAALTPELTDRDRRLFEAGVIAHEATGAPLLTHTEGGLGGMNQIEELLSLGVQPDRIALSHTDKIPDFGYHRTMAETGVFLCYDQGLRTPTQTAGLVDVMTEAGFGHQIVLGTDGARRSLWATLGGDPGLAYLYTGFPTLIGTSVRPLFEDNPARWLTMGV